MVRCGVNCRRFALYGVGVPCQEVRDAHIENLYQNYTHRTKRKSYTEQILEQFLYFTFHVCEERSIASCLT